MVFRVIFILLSFLFFGQSSEAGVTLITDDSGYTIDVDKRATRIVSLYPGHSENLLFLGLGNRLVGVSQADEPHLFPGLPRLSRRIDPETVMALNPDLVLVRPMIERFHGKALNTLRRLGIKVCSLNPPTWENMDSYVDRLAILTGEDQDFAKERVKSLFEPLQNEKKGLKCRKRFFVESMTKGLRTCSPNSWAANLVSLAGGVNVASDAVPLRKGSSIASYGLEKTLSRVSDGLDIYIVQRGVMNDVTSEDIMARPWISALEDVQVVVIKEQDLSRPSLLRLKKSVENLRNLMYSNEL